MKNGAGKGRVLIVIRGGIAEYSTDLGIQVCLVDLDNEPEAEIPAAFQYLEGGL